MKEPGLLQGVLPRGGLEHHQAFVRRAGQLPGHDLLELGQLVHQVRLGMEAPGGIDEEHIDAASRRRLHGVEDNGGGVGARTLPYH